MRPAPRTSDLMEPLIPASATSSLVCGVLGRALCHLPGAHVLTRARTAGVDVRLALSDVTWWPCGMMSCTRLRQRQPEHFHH